MVACSTASLAPAAPPAGADQVASLQAQAAQIAQAMVLEQLQIGGYQQQYDAEVAKAQQDQQLVDQLETRIAADRARIAHDADQLRDAAVHAYVDAGATAGADPLFGDQATAGARTEYGEVVSGDLNLAVDQLHTDQQALAARQAAQQQAVAADQAAEATARSLLAQSENTQSRLAAQNAQVHGQLAEAVAEQQAAQAQAAAAAIKTAQAQAARSAATPSEIVVGTAAPAAAPAGGGTDPALNSFLQCVVQHESGGDYQIVSPTGKYMGAFQFSQSTWNVAARLAGRPTLVGVPPNQASKADQDTLAVALYNADGEQPWYDPCNPTHP
ncbi:MAG TPA: transglycosylase family protein [Acidimicrobiales bacterium]|nr:transglycosylase family protein [Acidimicrobiales bacterium]